MDYAEEQSSELEALESIYPSEFKLLGSDPSTCTIEVQSSTYDEETGQGYRCTLKFTLPPKYPEEVPEIDIMDDEDETSNLEETDIEELKELLVEEAAGNTGMGMIFTIVSAAQEWMSTRWDTRVKRAEEEAEKRLAEVEEAERHRFDGTRVTVQSFIEWKIRFEAEMKMKEEVDKEKEAALLNKKLTGKELFLRDKTLNESDLQFLEEGYESVPIDESLFDDVDDLEIEDDDED